MPKSHTNINILTLRTHYSGCVYFSLTECVAALGKFSKKCRLYSCIFLSFLLVILVLWNSCLQLVWYISCPNYGCILLVRLWCFLQASQEPKRWRILSQKKMIQLCPSLLLFSYFLAILLPLHISFFFHEFQISKSAPGPASGQVPLISKMASPSLQRKKREKVWISGKPQYGTDLLPSSNN